jgi:adenosylcobinamide-phosphate synthase
MTAGTLLLACALDAILGDPRWLPHPVRLMGRTIAWYEQGVRRVADHRTGELVAGMVLAVGLPAVSYSFAWLAIEWSGRVHEVAGKGMEVLLAFTTLASRDLADHAVAVGRALKAGALDDARLAVARIVGRDTAQLSEAEVVRATVETVAESTSDGIVAPLFFLILGGAPLALAYKAISTLDSMVGHLDARYRYVGWASARLDDAANWIPARLTAFMIVISAGVVFRKGENMKRAWDILWRDGKKHPSPNGGHPEAAMAGALGVRLGGMNFYEGVPSARPVLGESVRSLSPPCIGEALRVMWTVCALTALLAAGLLLL